MNYSSEISKIEKAGLCLGCGLCESISGKNNVEMQLGSNGFFRPNVKRVNPHSEQIIKKICPGLNVVNDLTFSRKDAIWGKIDNLYSSFSNDKEVRTKGSSGGIVSALGIFMLKEKLVDAVLQVGGDSTDYERNTLKVSKTKEEVLDCASSRYAPALVFDKILELLDGSQDTYCFIGKPCDISALKNFLLEFPKYTGRFKLSVSIVCAGMPSFRGTNAIIEEFKATKPVTNLLYRGNGWPGYFSFTDNLGKFFRKTYNDSWGKTLNKHLNFRCKICPDGIGLQADIAVGDAWETKDGYPDFTEKEGHSLVISRTKSGTQILNLAVEKGEITSENLDVSKIKLMQPYQHHRRKVIPLRTLAFTFATGIQLNYKNVQLWGNIFNNKPTTAVKEFWGTFRRSQKL